MSCSPAANENLPHERNQIRNSFRSAMSAVSSGSGDS